MVLVGGIDGCGEVTLTVLLPQLLQRCPRVARVYVEDVSQQGNTWWLWDWGRHVDVWCAISLGMRGFAIEVMIDIIT